MGKIEYLRPPTEEEALRAQREIVTNSAYDLVRQGGQSLKLLPKVLLKAFECEAWKERATPNGASVHNRDFLHWVTAEYPVGIGSTIAIVEAILLSAEDKGEAANAKLLLDRAMRREAGGANNPEGAGGHTGKVVNVDIVHVDKSAGRPAGNAASAGLRRLEKSASNGNERAKAALSRVLAGEVSVNKAMIDCGFRKSNQVDLAAAKSIAMLLAAHVPENLWTTVKTKLIAARAKAIADAFCKITDIDPDDSR